MTHILSVGIGLALAAHGAFVLSDGDLLIGVILALIGGVLVSGAARPRRGPRRTGLAALTGLCITLLGYGVDSLRDGRTLLGILLLVLAAGSVAALAALRRPVAPVAGRRL